MSTATTESAFARLSKINVNEHCEKKNGLTYLSWSWAVHHLLSQDPLANWSYGEPVRWGETVMVSCTVTAFGKPMTAQLPVMDHRNKAIPNPDAFQVNVAMQRCLAKAISLHGIGLYIYAGEDLPDGAEEPAKPQEKPAPAPAKVEGIKPDQLAELAAMSLNESDNVLIEKALAKAKLKSIEEFNADQAQKTIDWVKGKK